jgi:hypothetical protein
VLTPDNRKQLVQSDLLLLLLFLATVAVIFLRVNAEGTGYTSPDSIHYLGLAQNIKDGNGLYVLNESGIRSYFSIWPIGYPILIYLVSELSTLDVYWSSKLLNVIFLITGFITLRQLSRAYAFIIASVYTAYTFLEVYSFTWSEAPFIFVLLFLAYAVSQLLLDANRTSYFLIIFLCCLALFALRYMGIIYFGIPAVLSIFFCYKRNYQLSVKLLFATLILITVAIGYLYINYIKTGYLTGGERFAREKHQTITIFLLMSLKGLLNEFLIIREYRHQNQPDYLLYITALIQLAVITFISIKVRRHYNFWQELKQNSFSLICIGTALLYLVAILAMRLISHFDALDYRLLAPFSFPLFIGLVYTLVSLPDKHKDIVQAKYALFAFFILSLILNLPKKFILQQLQQIL